MARKPMTWNEVCAFKDARTQITTLTPAQLAEAQRIIDEFNAHTPGCFAGIQDRLDWVKRELRAQGHTWAVHGALYEAVQELLSSVNPEVSRRIVEAA